ncbi:MAG TPA: TraR/DksA C4-type zinc finger protein [Verrucomicrobiae bacterium]|nr:TraR/DksA C4-type zinc finger protein [Verrucomicrobiae bacterium]
MAVTASLLGSAPRDPAVARHIDARWLGYYRVLLALRRRLVDERTEELAAVASPLESHGMSLADTATDEFDHDMLLAELSTVQDRLFEVDEALRRIENHTYGICELTGKPIPAERLRAIPWTRFTEDAAEQLEQEQAVGRPHLGELHSARKPRAATLGSAETELETSEPAAEGVLTTEPAAEEEADAELERQVPLPTPENREVS